MLVLHLTSFKEYLSALGKAVKDKRRLRQLSQADLVSAVHGISLDFSSARSLAEETISRIENGRLNLSMKQLFLISAALDTSPSELLDYAEELIRE